MAGSIGDSPVLQPQILIEVLQAAFVVATLGPGLVAAPLRPSQYRIRRGSGMPDQPVEQATHLGNRQRYRGFFPFLLTPFFAAGAFVRLSPDYRQVGMGQHRQSLPRAATPGVVCRQRPSHYRTLHCFRPAFHCLSHSTALLSTKYLLPSPEPPGRFSIITPVELVPDTREVCPRVGIPFCPYGGQKLHRSRRRWPPRKLLAIPPTPRSAEQVSGEKLLTVGPCASG